MFTKYNGITYLVLATPQSFESSGAVRIPSPDGHKDLTNVHTRDKAIGLAERSTHTSLKPIGSSARQHLVDADDMVRVDADTQMETFLSGNLDEVLVGANAGGFERLRGQLLVLVGDQVDAEREVVDVGALAAEIEDADLGVGYTTVEPALGVLWPSQSAILYSLWSCVRYDMTYGLVLAVAVAAGGTACHCVDFEPGYKSKVSGCSKE
jgi:hypothetical protein